MYQNILFIGVDVHKETIKVSAWHEKVPWGTKLLLLKATVTRCVDLDQLVGAETLYAKRCENLVLPIRSFIFVMMQALVVADSILLRHDIRYLGKTSWTEAHLRWLAKEVSCPSSVQ